MQPTLILGLLLVTIGPLRGQSDTIEGKHTLYGGFVRQGILYIKYERLIFDQGWAKTIANIGYGGVPGEQEYGTPRTNKIMPQLGQLIGKKSLLLELGLEVSFNFFGKISYTDINGILGIRYQAREYPGLLFQLGYNPKLYYTYENDIDLPFYIGMGRRF
jgi:hypothetical protein